MIQPWRRRAAARAATISCAKSATRPEIAISSWLPM